MRKDEIKEIKDEFEDCYGYPIGDEYIFSIYKDRNTYFIITPKSYWDNEGCQYDQSVSDMDGGLLKLPRSFSEYSEGQFSYNGRNIKDGIQELINTDVKFSMDFQKFLEEINESNFDIDGVSINQYMLTNYPNYIV